MLEKKTILVVGDYMLDRYIFGKARGVSGEAPVPILDYAKKEDRLGGAANTANNLLSLGALIYCCGVRGEDAAGKDLCRLLERVGADISGLFVDTARPTTLKQRIVAKSSGGWQQVVRLDYESRLSIDKELESKLISYAIKKVSEVDGIVFSDYAKGVLTKTVASDIIGEARKRRKLVFVDPKPRAVERFCGADLICPNRNELEKITEQADLKQGAQFMQKKYSIKHVVVTCGEGGIFWYVNEKNFGKVPAVRKEVFDVSGAGDTVLAILSLALTNGWDFQEAVELANVGAGIVVGKRGTATVSLEELEDGWKKWLSMKG